MAQFYYFERHCPGKRPQTESGEGSATSMCSIASTLSDAEVLSLAQYFSMQ
jgi:cytochrome c553